MPCHRNVLSMWGLEAVSGDYCCVSMQLGCPQYKCPQQRCPTWGGSSEFLGIVQVSAYFRKITFPIGQVTVKLPSSLEKGIKKLSLGFRIAWNWYERMT